MAWLFSRDKKVHIYMSQLTSLPIPDVVPHRPFLSSWNEHRRRTVSPSIQRRSQEFAAGYVRKFLNSKAEGEGVDHRKIVLLQSRRSSRSRMERETADELYVVWQLGIYRAGSWDSPTSRQKDRC